MRFRLAYLKNHLLGYLEFYIPLDFRSLVFVSFLQFSPKVHMVQKHITPHSKVLMVDIKFPLRQEPGIIRDRPCQLIMKSQNFQEKRVWQVLEPATLLSFRNVNVHYAYQKNHSFLNLIPKSHKIKFLQVIIFFIFQDIKHFAIFLL